MSSMSTEHQRLFAGYRSHGRPADEVNWAKAHLAGSAVVVETASSAYVFVPIYLGQEHVAVPGGGFRMACFGLDATGEDPDVLLSRPYDVKVGEELWFSLAEDKRTTSGGVTLGEVAVDLDTEYPTSKVQAVYVVPADPGAPEF